MSRLPEGRPPLERALPLALVLLALAPRAAGQATALSFDEPLVLSLEDERALDGRGPSAALRWVADFEGTLRLTVSSDALDPMIEVRAESGARVEDEDAGGCGAATVEGPVAPGDVLAIVVAAEAPDAPAGAVRLRALRLPESDATRAADEAARAVEGEAQRLLGRDEVFAAAAALHEGVDALLAAAEREGSRLLCTRLEALGFLAFRAGEPALGARCWEAIEAYEAALVPEGAPPPLRLLDAISHQVLLSYELDPPRAVRLAERALADLERCHPGAGEVLDRTRHALALALKRTGDLARARELEERMLAESRAALGPEHDRTLGLEQNLANTCRKLGDLEEALALARRVWTVRRRSEPPDSRGLVMARKSLMIVLDELGDPRETLALLEDAWDHARALPEDHPDRVGLELDLAAALRDGGDRRRALDLSGHALEVVSRILPDGHPFLTRARRQHAVDLAGAGRLDEARALEERLVETLTRALGPDDRGVLGTRHNLALTRMESGDVAGAVAELEELLDVLRERLPGSPLETLAQESLALGLYLEGDFERGLAAQDRLLDAMERRLPAGHVDLLRVRGDRLLSRIAAGRTEGAREDARRLVRELEDSLAEDARRLTPRALEERALFAMREVGAVLSAARATELAPPDADLDALAFGLSESVRAVTLAAPSAAGLDDDEELSRLRALDARASRRLAELSRDPAADVAALEAAREELDEARRATLARVVALAPDAADGAPPAADELARRLAPGQALVCYWGYRYDRVEDERPVAGPQLLAWVVRRDAPLARVELGELAPVEAAVDGWRAAIAAGAGGGPARGVGVGAAREEPDAAAADELRRLVLDPLLPLLDGARQLVVVADGPLHVAPLDALPLGGDAGRRLRDRLRVERRATVRGLLADARPPAGEGAVLLVGGADFDGAPGAEAGPAVGPLARGAGGDFPSLPATRAEAEALARLAEEALGAEPRLLLGAEATVDAFLSAAPGARFVHVATHGWFDRADAARAEAEPVDARWGVGGALDRDALLRGRSPLLSCGLAFAGAARPADAAGRARGLVTAEELAALDLHGCELVVLSACETALGEAREGQGVHSLQRALLSAGARRVVSSLWPVPDEPTRALMVALYRGLWERGLAFEDALRAAQDELRAAGHPLRDWAGWVAIRR